MTPPLIIRRTILAELARSRQFALPREQLLTQVNVRLRPALTEADLAEHLGWLKDHDMVDFLPDDMDPNNAAAHRWLIREAGLAALKQ